MGKAKDRKRTQHKNERPLLTHFNKKIPKEDRQNVEKKSVEMTRRRIC